MRAIVSLLLATALVTTPLKMVLAQAAQQEAVSVQQTAPPDSSGHRLIGVPAVTDNTSRLWQPLAGKDAIADIFAEDGSIPGSAPAATPISTHDARTAIIGLVVLATVVIGLVQILKSIRVRKI